MKREDKQTPRKTGKDESCHCEEHSDKAISNSVSRGCFVSLAMTCRGLLTISLFYLPFFLLSFIYLWLVVEPHLIYYGFGTLLPNAPLFATGWPFLRDSLGQVGGPVTYAAAFLSQGYVHSWLGASIIVLAGLGLSELTRRHLVTAGLARASTLASFPAIMFFLVYSQYNHPLTNGLAVSLGLLLSLVFEGLPLRRPPARVAAGCLTAAIALWTGGGGTLLVFALLTVIHAIFVRRDWTTAVAVIPASLAIAWVLAEYVFLIPTREALMTLTPFSESATAGLDLLLKVMVFLLYGFVPLAALLVAVGKSLLGMRRQQAGARRKKGTGKSGGVRTTHRSSGVKKGGAWYAPYARLAWAVVPIALLALGLYVSRKELRKLYVLSNCYSCEKRWDKIIELSHRLPKGRANPFVSHDILRALYHTGRLPYDMFRYPLVPEAILLTHEKQESDLTQWKLSDIFLELGHVNMAQKLASELVATKGPLGMALEELGWIGIIKGHPDTARVYLNTLKRDLVYRGRAESLLHALDSGFDPKQAAYIETVRSYMQGEKAGVTGTENVDVTLAALLKHNPRNKMAFEYLMACYLLTGRVDQIAENVDRLRDLGYAGIPTLYEEAILIHVGSQRRQLDLTRFPVSHETIKRYERFAQLTSAMGPQNQQAVLNSLIREFGTSYFFYYSFGRVGQV